MKKIVFIGGIADYINLRKQYHLMVNDIDIAFENENDIAPFLNNYGYKKYRNRFYSSEENEVIVVNIPIGGKSVHFDFFKKGFRHLEVEHSYLLGEKVMHAGFNRMRRFHNREIGNQTSTMQRERYEWKRLYKHSIKASLYNAVYHDLFTKTENVPLRCALTR
ncbi:hypothetical protein [Tenacibaculum xiamenense]|uniref:hypothetical protein n=1 Tax=Tenacibaculum xiamenense TaxID=1261553 RepID=UPI0038B65626